MQVFRRENLVGFLNALLSSLSSSSRQDTEGAIPFAPF